MKQVLGLALLGSVVTLPVQANESLKVVYPPDDHQTSAEQIFFIGTAPPQQSVTINGQVIRDRSPDGHFAPSLPLRPGENTFTLRTANQTLIKKVTKASATTSPPTELGFVKDSLTPGADIAKLPGEPVCFSAIATPNATVSVQLANQQIPLVAQAQAVALPPNAAVLTQTTQPVASAASGLYQGCITATQPGSFGKPVFQLSKNGQTLRQAGPGQVEILPGPGRASADGQVIQPVTYSLAEVTADQGVARTGPSTDYSRLTPLPQGTQAAITGREGEWLRLDYGGWINQKETRRFSSVTPARSLIRGLRSQQIPGWTEVIFPLEIPVPVTVDQWDSTFRLTLQNTTAQTDTIFVPPDQIISRLDWQQISPTQARYTFKLKSNQQWGYKLRYQGTSLVLSLRHPPQAKTLPRAEYGKLAAASSGKQILLEQTAKATHPLSGIKILLDPGHGSKNDLGSVGPTGYPEKDATLVTSKLLRDQLLKRGATVVMTREGDDDLYPQDRVDIINKTEPDLALSLHYNALPDNGDALNTRGIGAFWYHAQSHGLAVFLHDYLVQKLGRPSYGVFWNNLALTRPTVAPAVLLELGFMINPTEFEWITNPQAQKKLAKALAEGLEDWLERTPKRN